MIWHIEKLPFIWSHPTVPSHAPLPDTLPFLLSFDPQSGRLLQIPSVSVQTALCSAYDAGSVITGAMDEKGIGRQYADDFMKAIERVIHVTQRSRLRILDIGCGNGVLVRMLAQMGHLVVGIDPGAQLVETCSESVKLVRDYFPSQKVEGSFDLILAYALVEHMENPESFLRSLCAYLGPNGSILIAVPDCEEPISIGDPSMLVHEHYSYFTKSSLAATLVSSGYQSVHIERAGFGGMMYASAVPAANINQNMKSSRVETEFLQYMNKIESNLNSLSQRLSECRKCGKSVGVVVPGRIVNALTMRDYDLPHLRFFDDNPLLHGTYYPPFPIAIEPTEQMTSKPVDLLLVMSQTFGKQIVSRLTPRLSPATEVVTMTELYEAADVAAH